ncbi:Variant surface glycoprotein [Trypanosoma congolense IL3000]|uniref:Variant surface glycoprotein n=1 Tax=Trypanosoma congolense (strain IL3000) TaxID=1068625 RepID=F9WGJ3_TRYCI|nr:Variant surface glycoprotein [Trypanosoma congolense IL3000]
MDEVNMKHMVHILLLAIAVGISVRGVRGSSAIVEGSDNAEQFALLCRIYNVAKNPPINHVDVEYPLKIVNEIDAINASFIEEKPHNETEHVGNGSDAQLSHTTTLEAAAAQAILRRITEKSHTILEEIRKNNVTEEIKNVKAEFAHVIFGEDWSESNLCDVALKNLVKRPDACGKPADGKKGDSAGNNLVVDFFCLCSQRKEDGIQDACKVKVGGKGDNHGWSDQGPLGSSSMWASIKKECGNLLHKAPKSTTEAQEVLEDFLIHLKAGGVYKAKASNDYVKAGLKPGMLGTAVTTKHGEDLICDGNKGKTKPPGGICVYYGSENDWKNIPWLKKLKNSLISLDALNNKTATIQRDIEKLQMLLHRAEKIYETAKVITEVQNPVVPPNLQTATKRLTAYNAAWTLHPINHFILLWVLLQ